MNRNALVFLFVSLIFVPSQSNAQTEGESSFGPQKNGLSLQLTTKHKGGAESENLITVKLVNRSEKDVTLKTKFYYEEGKDFKDYFTSSLYFSSYPEVMPMSFSTSGTARRSPQVTHVLKAGEAITLRTTGKKGFIQGGDLSHNNLHMAKSGKYFIRAHAMLSDQDGKSFELWSNESPYVSGNSTQPPEAAVATILRYEKDGDSQVAVLNLNARSGVQVGDEFMHWSKRTSYRFVVSKTNDYHCKATVEMIGRGGRAVAGPPKPNTKIGFSKRTKKE